MSGQRELPPDPDRFAAIRKQHLAASLLGAVPCDPMTELVRIEARVEAMEARLAAEVNGLRLDNTRLRLQNAQLTGELDVYRRLAARAEPIFPAGLQDGEPG